MRTSTRSLFAVVGTLGLVGLVGCARFDSLGGGQTGSVRFSVLAAERQVQYVAGDIRAIRATVMDADDDNATVTSHVYTGAELASHLVSNRITFEVQNLKVNDGAHPFYRYHAKVETYLDAGATVAIGSSTTAAPFTVTAGSTLDLTLPTLLLAATPVGGATATGSNGVVVTDNPAPGVVWN